MVNGFHLQPAALLRLGGGAQGLGRAVLLRVPALGRVSALRRAANRSFKSSVEGCGALREASMGS